MSDYIYCGVWRRFGAYLLDGILQLLIIFCLLFFETIFFKIFYPDKWLLIKEDFLIYLMSNITLIIIIAILYWTLFESSKLQATPGKYLLNMKIINKDGTKISFLKSFSRLLLYLMIIIFGFGIVGIINLFCIIFTKQKTSIPDMVCNTRVVRR